MIHDQTSPPILTAHDTLKFLKQTDLSFRLLDAGFLSEVLENFQLHQLPEGPDFLEEAWQHLGFWETGNPVRIEEVTSFDSRCIACSFGKTVRAYEVNYSQALLAEKNSPRVHYTRSFAVNYLLDKGLLVDFAWCNGFLEKEDPGR